MKGRYLFGLPFICVKVNNVEFDCLIDTGFNGSILLPLRKIEEMNLEPVAIAKYALADNSVTESEIFEAEIEWFGKRKVPIVSSPSDFCLLGMELLKHSKTTLEPSKKSLIIEESSHN